MIPSMSEMRIISRCAAEKDERVEARGEKLEYFRETEKA